MLDAAHLGDFTAEKMSSTLVKELFASESETAGFRFFVDYIRAKYQASGDKQWVRVLLSEAYDSEHEEAAIVTSVPESVREEFVWNMHSYFDAVEQAKRLIYSDPEAGSARLDQAMNVWEGLLRRYEVEYGHVVFPRRTRRNSSDGEGLGFYMLNTVAGIDYFPIHGCVLEAGDPEKNRAALKRQIENAMTYELISDAIKADAYEQISDALKGIRVDRQLISRSRCREIGNSGTLYNYYVARNKALKSAKMARDMVAGFKTEVELAQKRVDFYMEIEEARGMFGDLGEMRVRFAAALTKMRDSFLAYNSKSRMSIYEGSLEARHFEELLDSGLGGTLGESFFNQIWVSQTASSFARDLNTSFQEAISDIKTDKNNSTWGNDDSVVENNAFDFSPNNWYLFHTEFVRNIDAARKHYSDLSNRRTPYEYRRSPNPFLVSASEYVTSPGGLSVNEWFEEAERRFNLIVDGVEQEMSEMRDHKKRLTRERLEGRLGDRSLENALKTREQAEFGFAESEASDLFSSSDEDDDSSDEYDD